MFVSSESLEDVGPKTSGPSITVQFFLLYSAKSRIESLVPGQTAVKQTHTVKSPIKAALE